MKKNIHIAKANILRHKGASLSLFAIIMLITAMLTVGLSVLLGVDGDIVAGIDRLNSLHSAFVMRRDTYNESFEGILAGDPRVAQYCIADVLFPSAATIDYGGEVELFNALFFNLETPLSVSAPKITEQDMTVPRESAIFLPYYAKGYGYGIGDDFSVGYRNKQINFTIAGFFETNELASINMGAVVEFYVPDECYRELNGLFSSSVWIAVRLTDIHESPAFNKDFAKAVDIELSSFEFALDSEMIIASTTTAVIIFSVIVIIFAILIISISLTTIRFRITSNIDSGMRAIGALKSAGYTDAQIVRCYLAEYGAIAVPAAAAGVFLPVPAFSFIRRALAVMSGFSWTLGVNYAVAAAAALAVTAVVLIMARGSCKKIRKLTPAEALSGDMATSRGGRNYFPLHRGAGNVHARLGIKNMFAYGKTYAMTGLVIAGISLAASFIAVMYQYFVTDQRALVNLVGMEISDVTISVTRHTDARAMAEKIGRMPEVRKTSMSDNVNFEIGAAPIGGAVAVSEAAQLQNDSGDGNGNGDDYSNGDNNSNSDSYGDSYGDINSDSDANREPDYISVWGYVSDDFDSFETMSTHMGGFPQDADGIACTKLMADYMGRGIGDKITVKTAGVSQEYVITGYFSVMNNMGRVAAMTLDGYRRLVPNYERASINVYLEEGASYDGFVAQLSQRYGVLNEYRQGGNAGFAAAKAKAEEKISFYLERYNIDSVAYAVIYNGEIILSGSSDAYQIEKFVDNREQLASYAGVYSNTMSLVAQLIAAISFIIIALILAMTVRSIVAKRRRELGALKAFGYTASELARQLAISFVPAAAVGVAAGCAAGAAVVSPAMNAMFASSGAYNVVFTASPPVIIVLGLIILAFSYTVANMSAMGIKNISAYELMTE